MQGDRKTMKKLLIAYYSWSNGNTKRIAELLQAATQADIVQIDTVEPYQGRYDDVVQQGQEEVQRGYLPAIKPILSNLDDYEVVAVGTPTWWYTMAPAVLTFLSDRDWKGKTVIPFMTNGGWPGDVIKDIKKACAGANFIGEKEIRFDSTGGAHMETGEQELQNWIETVKSNCQG